MFVGSVEIERQTKAEKKDRGTSGMEGSEWPRSGEGGEKRW